MGAGKIGNVSPEFSEFFVENSLHNLTLNIMSPFFPIVKRVKT
jgi:hypothetical protein